MTKLSVNVNKIAVLRNSRGGSEPDPCAVARMCIAAGCAGITVHPRPDGRHIRHSDVQKLRALCKDRVEFNIEGNPFAPPREGYPGLLELVRKVRPEQCTLVPDGDGQLTSDHGFSPRRDSERLAAVVAQLKTLGSRVSVFMDVEGSDLDRLSAIGVDRIEIYTGPYARAHALTPIPTAAAACASIAGRAKSVGLGVNAGHDLSQANLGDFLSVVPDVLEVSIGHALVSESLYDGLSATIGRYLAIIEGARRGA